LVVVVQCSYSFGFASAKTTFWHRSIIMADKSSGEVQFEHAVEAGFFFGNLIST